MVVRVSRFDLPDAGIYRVANSVDPQLDPDWYAAGDAAKKGGSGAKAPERQADARVPEPVQTQPAGGNPIVSLVNSQGFQAARPATQRDLLRAMNSHLRDAIFSHGLQMLASNPAFANLTQTQKRVAIQAFDRVARGEVYQGKSNVLPWWGSGVTVSAADQARILGNTTKAIISQGFHTAQQDVQEAMLAAVQKHATDDAASANIVSLVNSQGFQTAKAAATQIELLGAMDRLAEEGIFGNALQNLAGSPAFPLLTLDQQSGAIHVFERVASGEAYRGKQGVTVSDEDRQQIFRNLESIVMSAEYQSSSRQSVIADALDVTGIGTVPATPGDAPRRIAFQKLQPEFDAQWANTYPGGQALEQCGTLVSNHVGDVSMINLGGFREKNTSMTFYPNLSTGPDQNLVAVFHTHPDTLEGRVTDSSVSGGDAALLINNALNANIAQSRNHQFIFLRTGTTPSDVDHDALHEAQNKRIWQLQDQGMSFARASEIAAKETAQKYGLAYYKGRNGVLQRMYPFTGWTAQSAIADPGVTVLDIVPATPRDAPKQIDLSALKPEFNRLWGSYFEEGHLQGGTLVADNEGNVSMIHLGGFPGTNTDRRFRPDLSAGQDQNLLGIFYTLGRDSVYGGTGISAVFLINHAQNVIIEQKNDKQFMFLRTGATPSHVDTEAVVNAENQRINWLKSSPQRAFLYEWQKVPSQTAEENGLAYYEGTNGVFKRVYP